METKGKRNTVCSGGMLEAGIGRVQNVALSTLPGFTLPGDVSASKRYWKEDIIAPEVEVALNGTIKVKDEVGTGYTVRKDQILKLTVREQSFQTTPTAVS